METNYSCSTIISLQISHEPLTSVRGAFITDVHNVRAAWPHLILQLLVEHVLAQAGPHALQLRDVVGQFLDRLRLLGQEMRLQEVTELQHNTDLIFQMASQYNKALQLKFDYKLPL